MKKKYIIMVSLSVILTLLLGVGISYSLWNINVSQDKVNTAMTSCFDIIYSSETSAINLEKQYPISDEAGSKLTSYTFKITNNCDINAYYKINLETLNTSNIDTRFIKASLNNTNPQVINRYNETEVSLKNGKVANTLKTGYLPVGGSLSFDLRVWLDYDTTINDIKNDGTDKWVGKIVVISSPVAEDEINMVCQEKGGDLIDGGECRKYYVKLNNYIYNSNFSEDTKGWLTLNSSFKSYDNSYLSFECLKGACGFYQAPLENAVLNDLYYLSVSIKPNSNSTQFYVGLEAIWLPLHANNVGDILWHRYSNIFLYNQNVKDLIDGKNSSFVIYKYPDDTDGFYTKNLNFIDLTLMFGEGNEPSQEWCDKYLDKYIEYNLEGTLIPIKEIGKPVKTSYYDVISLEN